MNYQQLLKNIQQEIKNYQDQEQTTQTKLAQMEAAAENNDDNYLVEIDQAVAKTFFLERVIQALNTKKTDIKNLIELKKVDAELGRQLEYKIKYYNYFNQKFEYN